MKPFFPRLEIFIRLGLYLAALFIAILSLMPAADVPTTHLSDKLNHFLAYAGLTGLASLAWMRVSLLRIVCIIIVFGLVLEVAQGVMPFDRSASSLDMLANIIGAFTGAGLGAGIREFLKRLRQI